MGMVFCH